MHVEFLGQPFNADRRLGTLLPTLLPEATSLLVIVAWSQISGLKHIQDGLELLQRRANRTTTAILGIDGQIATRSSLELCLNAIENVYVFHDTSDRLFHPKIYCLRSERQTLIFMGSSNLTGGGLFRNYESNLLVTLQNDDEEDHKLYSDIMDFERTLRDQPSCKRLTAELLEQIADDASLLLDTEEGRPSPFETTQTSSIAREIFGPPAPNLPSMPTLDKPSSKSRAPHSDLDTATHNRTPLHKWRKRLTPSDVLRKPDTSHQRNYVALNRAGQDIDFRTWFRNEFFAGEDWERQTMKSGNEKEVLSVPFEVIIENDSIGIRQLTIDHSEARIAGQNNTPTYLNWSSIIDIVRDNDFRNWWLELVRFDDQSYQLRLRRTEDD